MKDDKYPENLIIMIFCGDGNSSWPQAPVALIGTEGEVSREHQSEEILRNAGNSNMTMTLLKQT